MTLKDAQALEICSESEKTSTKSVFSEQQLKIIQLKAKKYKQTEIAREMRISASAVRTQVQRIKEKISKMTDEDEKKRLEHIFSRKQEEKSRIVDFTAKNTIFKNDYIAAQRKLHFRKNHNKSEQIKDLVAKHSGRLFSVARENAGIMKIIARELAQRGYVYYSSHKDRTVFFLSKKFDISMHKTAEKVVTEVVEAVFDAIINCNIKRLKQLYLAASREILNDEEIELRFEEKEWIELEKLAEEVRAEKQQRQRILLELELETKKAAATAAEKSILARTY